MPSPTQQLLSRTIYTTDGTTTDWNFSFSGGYLDQAHVQAYTESPTGVRTDLTINVSQLIGPYQLRISPALAIGDILVIYRATPRDLPMVDFTDGSGLSETALDVSAKQAVFLAAEIADETGLAGVAAAAGYAQAAEEQAILANASATSAAGSELSAAASASAAAASLDSFDDRYLGSKASNPTLDNDGNALLVGAMYWNSLVGELRFWSGSSWQVANLSGVGYILETGANGSAVVPTGTTAQRDASPSAGFTRFNSTLNSLEVWNGVTWDQIQAGVIQQADLAANVAGTGPCFGAYTTAATSIGTSYTKVVLNTTSTTPQDRFDTVNSRFQPTVAGIYQLNFAVGFSVSIHSVGTAVYKNGAIYKYGQGAVSGNSVGACTVALNGTTDYVELFAISGTVQNSSANASSTYFQGYLARSA